MLLKYWRHGRSSRTAKIQILDRLPKHGEHALNHVIITIYDSLREIAGQLKIDFQKLILGKELIFMKMFENVFCYFGYSLNLVF